MHLFVNDECYAVGPKSQPKQTDEAIEVYDALITLALDQFHSNEVLESGDC